MSRKTKPSKGNHTKRTKRKLVKIGELKNLRKIRENVAGIDVGGEFHFVAAPDSKHENKITVNRFGSFTTHLRECVMHLKKSNIESVVMEATGVYWMTLYAMLEKEGIEVVLVNARDLNKIKDKKTDVCDAEYLQLYHSYGLLQGSFIPTQSVKELRSFSRLRERYVMEAATAIQRMQKALIEMNLRLDNVLSDISGITGMGIIKAILRGERDPKELAKLRDCRCRKSEEEIEDSLDGFYQEDHLFALQCALSDYEFELLKIDQCDEKIQIKLSEFKSADPSEELEEVKSSKKKSKAKARHEFAFDLRKELARITGVDLLNLPGVGASTALTLLAETGLDMNRWKSAKHFASWLRLCPNVKISGGKVLKKGTGKGKSRAAISLRMAVSGLYSENNNTALGAFYRRKRSHIGSPKAITAAANKLARMYYMLLQTGKPFKEPGAEAYLAMQKGKYIRKLKRILSPWGYEIRAKESVKKTI